MENRIIKFRAWIIAEKEMSYQDSWFNIIPMDVIQYADQGYWINNLNASDEHKKSLKEKGVPIEDEFILMQFTGWKDTNGHDIFEGDVLRFPDSESNTSEMGTEWYDIESIGVVEWDSEQYRWNITGRQSIEMDEIEFEHSCIIGNIYKNPELLTA